MKEVIEGEFAFGIEYGNAYIQKKNGEIIWLDQLASQFYNHGPVRLTIEPLPVAPEPHVNERILEWGGLRNCKRNRKNGCAICQDCPFRIEIEQSEAPAPGPGADDKQEKLEKLRELDRLVKDGLKQHPRDDFIGTDVGKI